MPPRRGSSNSASIIGRAKGLSRFTSHLRPVDPASLETEPLSNSPIHLVGAAALKTTLFLVVLASASLAAAVAMVVVSKAHGHGMPSADRTALWGLIVVALLSGGGSVVRSLSDENRTD